MSVIVMDEVKTVATGLRFPEGPIALDDGGVLVVEIEGGTLTRVDPTTGKSTVVAHTGAGPNGAALGPDGAVYVADDGGMLFEQTEDGIRACVALAPGNRGGTVQRVDLHDGSVTTVATHSDGERIGTLNDIVFDTTGHYYVVDTSGNKIHYGNPATGDLRVVADDIAIPNGLGLSPDGNRAYVSETYSGDVYAYDVTSPGVLDNRRRLYTSDGQHGCDGLAVDGAGNVCVASLGPASGITVIGPDATVRTRFVTPVPDPYVTNICFGGPDLRTAYVCSAGRGLLYSVPWPWPGLRLNYAL